MFKPALIGAASAQFLGDTLTSGDYEFIQFVAKHGKTYETRSEFAARNTQF